MPALDNLVKKTLKNELDNLAQVSATSTNTEEEKYTVSKAAFLLGISASSLRKLELEGVINTKRASNGYRYFTQTDINLAKSFINKKKQSKVKEHTVSPPVDPVNQVENTPVQFSNSRQYRTATAFTQTQKYYEKQPPERPFHSATTRLPKLAITVTMVCIIFSGVALAHHKLKEQGSITQNILGALTTRREQEAVLADTSSRENLKLSFNTKALFKEDVNYETSVKIAKNLDVSGNINTNILNFVNTGTINGLQEVDDVTEATLERELDLTGDITSTGLLNVQIATNVIDDAELADTLTYTGNFNIGGLLSIDGTTGDEGDVLTTDGNGNPSWLPQSDIDAGSVGGLGPDDLLEAGVEFDGDVSGNYDNLQLNSGVVTSSKIADGTIKPNDLSTTNTATDAYIIEYDATTGNFTWIPSPAAGSSKWTVSGAITYLTDTTSELVVGGTTPASPFYFNPSTNLLTLTNTTVGNSFVVQDDTSDTTPFIINGSGNVGIGKTTADTKLDVTGQITTSGGLFVGIANDTDYLLDNSPNGASSARLYVGNEGILTDDDIGDSVQAQDTELSAIAAIATTVGNIIVGNGSSWEAQ